MSERLKPKVRVRRISPNRSARSLSQVKLIVVHSTEGGNVPGLGDLVGLGGWFANRGAQVSSHVATDAEGNSARYVADRDKAWHCGGFNSVSLGIEQVGRAAQLSWPVEQEKETARWIAYWSKLHGIPIQKGAVRGGSVVKSGIVRHSDLGAAGGNHHDPGRGYDLHDVLEHARGYRRRY